MDTVKEIKKSEYYDIYCTHCGAHYENDDIPKKCTNCKIKLDVQTSIKKSRTIYGGDDYVRVLELSNSYLDSLTFKDYMSTCQIKRWFQKELTQSYDKNSVTDLQKRIELLERGMLVIINKLDGR